MIVGLWLEGCWASADSCDCYSCVWWCVGGDVAGVVIDWRAWSEVAGDGGGRRSEVAVDACDDYRWFGNWNARCDTDLECGFGGDAEGVGAGVAYLPVYGGWWAGCV